MLPGTRGLWGRDPGCFVSVHFSFLSFYFSLCRVFVVVQGLLQLQHVGLRFDQESNPCPLYWKEIFNNCTPREVLSLSVPHSALWGHLLVTSQDGVGLASRAPYHLPRI